MRFLSLSLLLAACHHDGSDGTSDDSVDGVGDDDDDDVVDTDTGTATTEPNLTTDGDAEVCVVLFGGNDRVRGADDGLPLGNDARTLQAWVRTASAAEQVALSYGHPYGGQGFLLGTSGGYGIVRAGTGVEQVVGRTYLADDEWHHLVASYDGTLAVLTVDGVSDGTGLLTVDSQSGDSVAGNTPTGDLTTPWVGWIADARIFHAARTPSDIAADPDGDAVPPDQLLLHWDFELAPNSMGNLLTVPDVSGHGLDGTTGGTDSTPLFTPCR